MIKPRQKFHRPKSFLQGVHYLRLLPAEDKSDGDISIVAFSSYTASPAYLVVLDKNGNKIRCPRDDLYELPGENHRLSASRINFIFERFKSLAGIMHLAGISSCHC
jgi:hypothetical protein